VVATKQTFGMEALAQILQENGQRMTRKRRGILQSLLDSKQPLALQEIRDRTEAVAGIRPDYATVFRLVTVLEKLNLVNRVNLQRSSSYFELNDPGRHYDHLVCRTCGTVVVLDIPCPVRQAEKQIVRQYGFREVSHSLEFFGVCPLCTT